MQIAWLTDTHLNFLTNERSQVKTGFLEYLKTQKFDGIFLTGDISDSRCLNSDLTLLHDNLDCHIFFVLGNHDFYHSDVETVKTQCDLLSTYLPNLHYLDKMLFYDLTEKVAVTGNSGFYDVSAGGDGMALNMSDHSLIADIANMRHHDRVMKCKQIAENMAVDARKSLLCAANMGFEEIYFLTHVPPFPEAAWHKGKRSDNTWLPWFCNVTFGNMLAEVAESYEDIKFTVLCGHTHSSGEYQHSSNLKVLTGAAVYAYPTVHKTFTIEKG